MLISCSSQDSETLLRNRARAVFEITGPVKKLILSYELPRKVSKSKALFFGSVSAVVFDRQGRIVELTDDFFWRPATGRDENHS
jgi:hypothetical protein